MKIINNKRSKHFFYRLNSNYGRKFSQSPSHQVLSKVSHRQIPNFSRPSTRFPKQFKETFSFLKFKDFSRLALNSRPVQEPCNLLSSTCIIHLGMWLLFVDHSLQFFSYFTIFALLLLLLFFQSVLWHCWLGDRKGIRPVQKLGVGLLVVTFWSFARLYTSCLCTSYSSSCYHSPPPSP